MQEEDNATESVAGPSGQEPVPCYIITHSVAKKHNIGTIVRSATAFGVKEVCLVGSRQFNTFGSHGSDAHVAFRHYENLQQCVQASWVPHTRTAPSPYGPVYLVFVPQHLKEAEGCRVLGIEICSGALPVHEHPFTGPTAFLLGNEGQGLSEKQMALCDGFVYIPQHGPGTASLNVRVAVAASIVLHHFAIWAAYPEREREGYKYVVADKPLRTMARGVVRDSDEAVREQRQRRRAEAAEAEEGGAWGGGLFGEEVEDEEEQEEGGDAEAGDEGPGAGEAEAVGEEEEEVAGSQGKVRGTRGECGRKEG
ncbi:hypothetical protein GPECTOR_45g116 [Gonium pectorale]|uniref:tRNA/rRNA methyltransferase SpoU type domain-containing protein n=1 Tax=Gonium pectorale TaxID=33097 RepID=A0A150G8R1_GONPE|nr:hypothetical protein GPECTOR_45g116 [Gonium pectorale]|eukprot:KXZ46246.1 hypothetical protein GPECTOR_45g116 [Gonium pectorale]